MPEIVRGRTDMHAYICGLDKMIKANRELLKGLGWDRKSILYEKYDYGMISLRPLRSLSAPFAV